MADRAQYKPLWRRLLVYGGSALAGLVVAGAGFALWLDTAGGHGWLARQIEARTASAAFRMEVGGISGSVYSRFTVNDIHIADAGGVWLEAGSVELDWQPWDLLGGALTLHEVNGGLIRILRLPEAGGEEAGDISLPFDSLRLEALSARIAPAFLEAEQEFDLSGKVRFGQQDPWRASLSLTPEGSDAEGRDSLSACFEWQPGERHLDADINLQAPSGGFLASLAGTDSYGDLRFGLELSGPLEQLSGNMEAVLGEAFTLTADVAEQEGTIRLAGETRYGSLLPANLTAFLGTEAQFDAGFRFPGTSRILINATAGNEQVRIGLEGPVLWQGGAVFAGTDVRAAMDRLVPDMPTIRAEGVQFTARLDGPILDPDVTFDASADSLILPRVTLAGLTADGTFAPRQDAWQANGSISAAAVDSGPFNPYLAEAGLSLEYSALLTGTEARNVNLQLRHGPYQAEASGALNYDLSGFDITAGGEVASLSGLSGLAGVVSSRSANFEANARRQDGALSANGRMSLAGARYGQDIMSVLLGAAPQLHFTLDRRTVQVNLESLDLRDTGLVLNAEGTVSPGGALSLDYNARLPENAGLAPGMLAAAAGRMTVTGRVTGPADNPAVTFATDLDQFDTGFTTFRKLHLEGTVESLAENLSGTVNLSAETAMAPVELSTAIRRRPEGLAFEDVRLAADPFEGQGEILLTEAGFLSGRVTISNRQAALGRAAGRRAEGNLDLSLLMEQRGQAQAVSLTGTMQNLRIIPVQGAVTDFDTLDISLEGRFGGAAPDMDLTLEGRGLSHGFMRLDSVNLSASGWPAVDYSLAGSGAYFQPVRFSASGGLVPGNAGRQLTLGLEADIGGQGLATSDPIMLTFGEEALSLDVPGLVSDSGRINFHAARTEGGIEAHMESENFPIRMVTFPWPRYEARGRLTSKADLALAEEGASASWQLTAKGLGFPFLAEGQTVFMQMDSNGTLAEGMLAGLITMSSRDEETGEAYSGRLRASLPVKADGESLLPIPDADGPLSAEVAWNGPVAPLWGVMRRPDHILEGHIEGNLNISGTLDNPDFAGAMRLDGGAYQHQLTGFSLLGLEVALEGRDREILITRLEGHDGAGGMVTGQGHISILENLDFPTEITVTADTLRLVRLPGIRATASGNITYARTPEGNSITGDIATDEVNLEINRSLPRNVVELEVREINYANETLSAQEEDAPVPFEGLQRFAQEPERSALDMMITIPGRMFVRGRGLDSEWQGRLSLDGTTDQPVINGTVQIVRGSFTFAGKRFDLTSGNIQFDGGRTIDPLINITSRASTPTLDATVALTGRLNSPQVQISSTPALPEDEILSRLLFGTSVAELSPLQIAELATAVNSLRGGGGLDVLGGARRTLGLDALTLESGAVEEGSLIRGGKYLSDNIYLELETATSTGDTLTRLRINLTDHIRAETAVGPSNRNSIKLKWFWDY